LEIAAVFEQLRQPLVDELARVVAERLALVLLQLAARPPVLAAEQFQQPLGYFQPGGVVNVQVVGDDAVAGVADAHHLAGQHVGRSISSMMSLCRRVRVSGCLSCPVSGLSASPRVAWQVGGLAAKSLGINTLAVRHRWRTRPPAGGLTPRPPRQPNGPA